jgi:hypothetical protein
MSTEVSIPSSYTFTVNHGSTGATIKVDADLDNVHVKEIPRIEFALKEIPQINVGVKEMPRIEFAVKELPRIEFALKELPPINIALTDVPDIRAHIPAQYDLGLSVFGIEILKLSLCGESQIITEKYEPRRAEACA